MGGAVTARPRTGWGGGAGHAAPARAAIVAPVARGGAGGRAIDLPRRHARGAVATRSRRRQERLGLVVGGIIVAFALGLFSLSQTVRVSATGYDLDQLIAERSALQDRERLLLSDINRLGREPSVRQQALAAGLGQLADPLVIPAR